MKIELAHDFIAKKIYEEASIEDKNRAKVAKLLLERYQHYLASKDLLLTERDLLYISPYVDTIALSRAQLNYIDESKKAVRRTKIKSRIKDAALVGLICAVFFSFWALWERNRFQQTSQELANAQDSIDVLLRNMEQNPSNTEEDNSIIDGAYSSAAITGNTSSLLTTYRISGRINNSAGQAIPYVKVQILGAEVFTKKNGSYELFLLLPPKELTEDIQIQAKKTNYIPVFKNINIDKRKIKLDFVLKRS